MRAFLTLLFLLFMLTCAAIVAVPNTFEVQRAVSVHASRNRVFALITDLRRFGNWSPWEGAGTEMKRSFITPSAGKDAVYEWTGNSQITHGRLEITSKRSPSNVEMAFEFARPFVLQNIPIKRVPPFDVDSVAELEIATRGGATVVTWTLRGKHSLPDKFKSLAASLNGVVGAEMEGGLARLKKLAEG